MKQLNFDEYRDTYHPGWRELIYSGFADPNEGFYYNWLKSGHAVDEINRRNSYKDPQNELDAEITLLAIDNMSKTSLEEQLKITFGSDYEKSILKQFINIEKQKQLKNQVKSILSLRKDKDD